LSENHNTYHNDFDDFAEDIEEINLWRKEHIELTHSIDKKLGILIEGVNTIKDNCKKEICKK